MKNKMLIIFQVLISFNILFAETTEIDKSISLKLLQESNKSISINKDIGKENLYKLLYENSVINYTPGVTNPLLIYDII